MPIKDWKIFAAGCASGIATSIAAYGLYSINKTNADNTSKSRGITVVGGKNLKMNRVTVEGYPEGGIALDGADGVETHDVRVSANSDTGANLIKASLFKHCRPDKSDPNEDVAFHCAQLQEMLKELGADFKP
jgi:hypothetical protein